MACSSKMSNRELDIIKKARDLLGYASVREAMNAIFRGLNNAIPLGGRHVFRYHHPIRGTVACRSDEVAVFVPLCPVKGCSFFGGGGHQCDHWKDFSTGKDLQPDIKALFKEICRKRGLDFNSIGNSSTHLEVIESVGKTPFPSRTYGTVHRLAGKKSLVIAGEFGKMILTCGNPGCFEVASNGYNTSSGFYCPKHIAKKTRISSYKVLDIYKAWIQREARKLGHNAQTLDETVWTKILATLELKNTDVIELNGYKLYPYVENRRLYYHNGSKSKRVPKCMYVNCFNTVPPLNDIREPNKTVKAHFCLVHQGMDDLVGTYTRYRDLIVQHKIELRK